MSRAANTVDHEPPEGWTERQRQVLDLIVKGKSNGEIAEALGLSLDGVKWHMREILSKLGVESRTEAAEYWRRRNGLPSRFARSWRAAVGLSLGQAAAIGAAAAVCLGAALVAVLFLRNGGDDEAAAVPTETRPSTATAFATTAPTGTQAATATPRQSIQIGGRQVPVKQAYFSSELETPKNLALTMTHGCWGCDEPDTTIERVWWDGDGKESHDVLFDAVSRGGSYLTRIATTTDGSHMVVGLCVRAYCGPMGDYQDAARVQLWETFDYGVSWKQIGQYDGQAFPLGFTAHGLIVERTERSGSGFAHYLLEVSTARQMTFPNEGTGNRPNPLLGPFSSPHDVHWVYPNGTVTNADGTTPEFEAPPGRVDWGVFGWGRGGLSIVWSLKVATGNDPQVVISRLNEGGLIADAVVLPSHTFWRPSWASGGSTQFAGSLTVKDIGQVPALVNVDTGEIALVRGPFEALAKQNDRNTVLAAQVGPFARVDTPGDCLNLRDDATGNVLRCLGDGALLTVLGADNVGALPVVFGPYVARVSFDFVELPAKAR
jgi:DNA-binding CsgD family transcriptional regulator